MKDHKTRFNRPGFGKKTSSFTSTRPKRANRTKLFDKEVAPSNRIDNNNNKQKRKQKNHIDLDKILDGSFSSLTAPFLPHDSEMETKNQQTHRRTRRRWRRRRRRRRRRREESTELENTEKEKQMSSLMADDGTGCYLREPVDYADRLSRRCCASLSWEAHQRRPPMNHLRR